MYSLTFYINYPKTFSDVRVIMYSIFLLIFLVLIFFAPYFGIIETEEFPPRSPMDQLLTILRCISYDLSKDINKEDGKLLRQRLQNTSFVELAIPDDNILAWNYDKGREIAIDIFDKNGKPYSADNIITSLLHELAHSLTYTVGHEQDWVTKNNYLQGFKDKYVSILINNTFIKK